MPFDLFDALGLTADAASVPDFRARRERIGCFIGLAIVGVFGAILFALSWV